MGGGESVSVAKMKFAGEHRNNRKAWACEECDGGWIGVSQITLNLHTYWCLIVGHPHRCWASEMVMTALMRRSRWRSASAPSMNLERRMRSRVGPELEEADGSKKDWSVTEVVSYVSVVVVVVVAAVVVVSVMIA